MIALSACHDGSTSTAIDANVSIAEASAHPNVDVDASPTEIVDAEADVALKDRVESAIDLLENAGEIVQANLADCEKMGERLEEYRQKHLDAVTQVDIMYEPKYDAELKKLQPVYRKRFKAAWAKVRPGVTKCKGTPTVKRVILEVWGDDPDAGM